MSVVEFVDVVKSYGSGPTEVRALTEVSLSVAPGEIVQCVAHPDVASQRCCTSQVGSRIRVPGG